MIQIRKEDNQKKQKEKKLKVYKVNTHKKTVIALWVLLAMSFLFAVYKNFTAIDIHTVHETKVIEETILDTHKIENFVENFAEVYYSWEQSATSIDNRTNALKGYLTGELQALNVDTVRKDIPVSSALTDFQIWEITKEKEQHYQVTYTVEQRITEGESSKTVRSAYQVTVYVDGSGNLTIIQNPTITSVPVKSGYTPKAVQSDGTVDSITTEEINEFLTTFFKLYPTATAKELTYYVNEGVLKPVEKNGGWRYSYGNMFYVLLVSQYLTVAQFDDETVQAIMEEALKYEGWTYVYGGDSPSTSFDCSGLVQWCYGKAGIALPRTAQEQYNVTQHIPLSEAKAGDLVFFHSTYNAGTYITHVGLYVGNDRMYHAGNPIGYADLTGSYWQQHFAGAGRIKQ